jgi:hypothetical protein
LEIIVCYHTLTVYIIFPQPSLDRGHFLNSSFFENIVIHVIMQSHCILFTSGDQLMLTRRAAVYFTFNDERRRLHPGEHGLQVEVHLVQVAKEIPETFLV